jgi:spore germination protein YaaH/flagellar hook assembly protein FlgD
LLGLLVLAGTAPEAVLAADPRPADPGLQPTIHYEDALAHAGDHPAFAPGARVSVPFSPRGDDAWTVDGGTPRRLPAGRISGLAMRSATEIIDAPLPRLPARTVGDDRPLVDPRSVIPGTGASWAAGDEPSFELAAKVDPGALRREVFGFLPYWELGDSSTRIDWSTVSTVAYFGVGADSDGSLIKRNGQGQTTIGWSGWTSSRMTRVIDAAHRNGTRVVLTVQSFGWSSTGLKRQRALPGSPSARARLARQIAAAVRDRGADGVNLDFEPIAKGYGAEFAALVRSVRKALDRKHRGYQLTFDATGSIGEYPIREATRKGGADAVLIMGYDYRNGGSKVAGSLAPIGGPTYDIRDTIRAYLREAPASKVILGVPYYGRAWSTTSSKLHAKNMSGAKYGPSVTVVYDDAKAVAAVTGRRYDPVEGVAWTAYKRQNCTTTYGCVTGWRQLYYDDARALKAKYDLVNGYGLRGVGIWALGYDGTRKDLTKAIVAKFIRDKVPPVIAGAALSANVVSPNGDGRADTTTASLKATGLIRWGVAIQVMKGGKAGRTVRAGSHTGKTPRFTWDGRDSHHRRVADGTYRLTLWAADINGNRSQRRFAIIVDRTKARIASSAAAGFVSPGHDGQADTVPLAWRASEPITGSVRLLDGSGKAVRSWPSSKLKRWSTSWAGTTAKGATVKDGRYTLRVAGLDRAGNRTELDRRVIVDRTIASVRWDRTTFRPSTKQTSRAVIRLARSATVSVRIKRGDALIRKGWTERALRAGSWGWTWDGRTAKGKLAPAGRYVIEVTARSRIGVTRFRAAVTVAVH